MASLVCSGTTPSVCQIVDGMADPTVIPDDSISTNDEDADPANLRPGSEEPFTSSVRKPRVIVKLSPKSDVPLGSVTLLPKSADSNIKKYTVEIKPAGSKKFTPYQGPESPLEVSAMNMCGFQSTDILN